MKILFVFNGLPLGGIETYIVRLSKQFKLSNYSVRILFYTNVFDEKLLSELSEYAEVFHWDDYTYLPIFSKRTYPLFKLFFPLKRKKIQRDILDGITHIHAPDTYALLFSQRIIEFNNSIKLSTGVYQINEYNIDKYLENYFGRYIKSILNAIPFQNVLFFNEISRDFYCEIYNGKFSNSTLTPIGVNLENYNQTLSGYQSMRIVSIGRLVHWKTYNYSMIDVVKKLRSKGINVIYESYGDGVLMDDLKDRVKKEGLEQSIYFNGSISYAKFKDTIENSLMFIGSGTSLIEASASGIPALIGIECELEPLSYGFLHDTNTYSYHEKLLPYSLYSIEDIILNLLNLSESEYRLECIKARMRANDFNMDRSFRGFLEMCNNCLIWKSRSTYLTNVRFVSSLVLHFGFSKIKNTYHKSYFNRFAIEN